MLHSGAHLAVHSWGHFFPHTFLCEWLVVAGSDLLFPSSISIPAASWNQTYSVNLTAPRDLVAEGDRTVALSFAFVTSDVLYSSLLLSPFTVYVIEVDKASFLFTPSSLSFSLTEGGASQSFSIRLSSRPVQTVDLGFQSSPFVTISPASISFDSNSWTSPVTVTMSALNNNVLSGYTIFNSTINRTTSDPIYATVPLNRLSITVADNDLFYSVASPRIGPAAGGTSIRIEFPEGITFKQDSLGITNTIPQIQCLFLDSINRAEPVAASLYDDRTVDCQSSHCQEGMQFVECDSPVDIIVLVNGQRSLNNSKFDYYSLPRVEGLSPISTDVRTSVVITVKGKNFINTPQAACRFDNLLQPANYTILPDGTPVLLCSAPARDDLIGSDKGTQVEVEITFDGQYFTSNGFQFEYIDYVETSQAIYWTIFWVCFNLVLLGLILGCVWDCYIKRSKMVKEEKNFENRAVVQGPDRLMEQLEHEREELLKEENGGVLPEEYVKRKRNPFLNNLRNTIHDDVVLDVKDKKANQYQLSKEERTSLLKDTETDEMKPEIEMQLMSPNSHNSLPDAKEAGDSIGAIIRGTDFSALAGRSTSKGYDAKAVDSSISGTGGRKAKRSNKSAAAEAGSESKPSGKKTKSKANRKHRKTPDPFDTDDAQLSSVVTLH